MILKTSSLKPKRKRKNPRKNSSKELGGRKAPTFKIGQRVTIVLTGHKPRPAIIVKPFSATDIPHLKYLDKPNQYSLTPSEYIQSIGKKKI